MLALYPTMLYNKNMTKAQRLAILVRSAARSMEAEGFNYEVVKKAIEQRLLKKA